MAAQRRAYVPYFIAGGGTAAMGYGLMTWAPSFFVRAHGITAAEAGKMIGAVAVVAGPIGSLAGGWITDRLVARGHIDAPMTMMMGLAPPACAMAALVTLAHTLPGAMGGLFVFEILSFLALPSLYGGVQFLTPDRFRGAAASTNMMIYTIAGLGLGPLAVGFVSDRLFAGARGVGPSLLVIEVFLGAVVAAAAFIGRRAFRGAASSNREPDSELVERPPVPAHSTRR